MTSTDTLERETLYVTDAELIRRMGVPEKVAREAVRALYQVLDTFPEDERIAFVQRFVERMDLRSIAADRRRRLIIFRGARSTRANLAAYRAPSTRR